MRINQPVSNQAYVLHPEQTLVSVTDTKGRITYCNESFIEASGFSKHELLGQPHNLVRHPDMPEEAFRDMWDTIQAGLPWSGLVKNRRKNGDYYWVQANATPMMMVIKLPASCRCAPRPRRRRFRLRRLCMPACVPKRKAQARCLPCTGATCCVTI